MTLVLFNSERIKEVLHGFVGQVIIGGDHVRLVEHACIEEHFSTHHQLPLLRQLFPPPLIACGNRRACVPQAWRLPG